MASGAIVPKIVSWTRTSLEGRFEKRHQRKQEEAWVGVGEERKLFQKSSMWVGEGAFNGKERGWHIMIVLSPNNHTCAQSLG